MSDIILEKIRSNESFFTEVRHHLHQNPELSGEEYETSAFIRSCLDEWHIPYERAGNTSIVASICGKKAGKTIALRGDIDALPVQEETGLAWKSQKDGVMHACGHDVHATFMLGCAKILNELKDELEGTVKIIFQESEENGAGAKLIMDSNLLAGVDSIAALHDTQELDLGTFALGYGVMSAYGAGGTVTIESDGKTNALIAAAELVSIVTALAEEKFPKSEQIVMVPTVVKTERNIDGEPVKVSVSYNSRTLNFANEEIMQGVLASAADKVQLIFDCKAKAELRTPGNVVNNDKYYTDLAADVIKKHFGENSLRFSRPVMSGEDFALFQKSIPGVYIHIGGATKGLYRVLHTSKTCVDDRILPIGIEFLIRYVFAFFS